jgi:hypothetical protein
VSITTARRSRASRRPCLAAADAAGEAKRGVPRRERAESQLQRIQPSTVRAGEDDHQPGAAGEERIEGNIATFAQLGRHLHCDSDHGADHGSAEYDRQDHLPAEPRAERSEQLEVAEAHAFLAGRELEHPVDRPEREIAGDRSPDGVGERNRPAERGARDADPDQRQGEVVGQQGGVPVDPREGDQRCAEAAPEQRDRHRAEAPADEREERPRRELDERIARGNRGAARRAARAQPEPARDGNVLVPGDLMAAGGTARARRRERERRCGFLVRDAEQVGAFHTPAALEHERQPVDDDVQEAADTKAEEAENERGEEDLGVGHRRSVRRPGPA